MKPIPQFPALRAAATQTHRPFRAIRYAMWAQEVTQKRLSEVVGVSQQAMCHKMQGRVDFTCREMLRICEYLGGTLDELFGDSS